MYSIYPRAILLAATIVAFLAMSLDSAFAEELQTRTRDLCLEVDGKAEQHANRDSLKSTHKWVTIRGFDGFFWMASDSGEWVRDVPPDVLADVEIRSPSVLVDMCALNVESATDGCMKAVGQCKNLVTLYIRSPIVTDRGYQELAELKHLKRLRIDFHYTSLPVTDIGLEALCRIRSLEQLRIDRSVVSDMGLSSLEKLEELKVLCIRSAFVRGSGFSHLSKLKQLEYLELGWPYLQIKIPKKGLLYGSEGVRQFNDGLEHLVQLPALKHLDLAGSPVSDKGLEMVARMPALRMINLNWTIVTDDGVDHLREQKQSLGVRVNH